MGDHLFWIIYLFEWLRLDKHLDDNNILNFLKYYQSH